MPRLAFRYRLVAFLAAVFVAGLLYLPLLGSSAFLDYDESGYAAVALDTAHSGDPLTLSIGPKHWFEKPPLYFWLSAASNAVIPDVELASRFPSALAGIAAVALTWLIIDALSGDALAASFGALLLATSASFMDISRQGRVDTLVIAASLLLVYAFIRALRDSRWLYLGALALAVGFMTKDVVALFLFPMLLLWLLLARRLDLLRMRAFLLSLLLLLALVLPWHFYETARFGMAFWNTYFFMHVLARYGTNLLASHDTNALYFRYLAYYAPILTALTVAVLGWYPLRFRTLPRALRHAVGALLFGIASVLFIFFTARTKVVYYLPFALPLMAIVIGLVASRLEFTGRRYTLALAFLASLAFGTYAYAHPDPDLAYDRAVARDERIIGLILRPVTGPVYFTDPAYWETVRFYSGEKRLLPWTAGAPRPAYVVVHTGYEAPLAGIADIPIYSGRVVSLYRVP